MIFKLIYMHCSFSNGWQSWQACEHVIYLAKMCIKDTNINLVVQIKFNVSTIKYSVAVCP